MVFFFCFFFLEFFDKKSEETDVGPAICKSSKDAVSQSARQPFLTAWATLSKCLFHIKGDVAEAVTMINAFKTSHLRPVASPFHKAKGAGDKTRRRSLNFSPQLKCVRAAPSVGRCRTWGFHNNTRVPTVFFVERDLT